jgi:5'-3' exonuclease
MLCLNHLALVPSINLFRETPHFIQSIDSSLEPNENYILNISQLGREIIHSMKDTLNNKNINASIENILEIDNGQKNINIIYDYIFMCFFLGNDFLPHFPALNIRTGGIFRLIDSYKEVISKKNINLTKNNGTIIIWNNVKIWIQFLCEKEEYYIKEEFKLRNKREKYFLPEDTQEQIIAKFDSIPNYDRELEKYIDPFKEKWQQRYYKALFHKEDKINHICINFLEGVEWNMKYYTIGCPDWRWKYKYNYPPLLVDLIKYIPDDSNISMVSNNYYQFVHLKPNQPVHELTQLCYVLPKASLHLLPLNVRRILLQKYQHWYNDDCDFVWAFCRYFWESHVELPEIDIDELENIIRKIK